MQIVCVSGFFFSFCFVLFLIIFFSCFVNLLKRCMKTFLPRKIKSYYSNFKFFKFFNFKYSTLMSVIDEIFIFIQYLRKLSQNRIRNKKKRYISKKKRKSTDKTVKQKEEIAKTNTKKSKTLDLRKPNFQKFIQLIEYVTKNT